MGVASGIASFLQKDGWSRLADVDQPIRRPDDESGRIKTSGARSSNISVLYDNKPSPRRIDRLSGMILTCRIPPAGFLRSAQLRHEHGAEPQEDDKPHDV